VLTATENGYGKRTPIVEYTRHGRGTKGMIAIQQSEPQRQGRRRALVRPDDEVVLISTGGVLIRTGRQVDPRDEPIHAGRDADQSRRRREARGAGARRGEGRRGSMIA
jgi:DNA gyrase/topoisomerase IV subunit A